MQHYLTERVTYGDVTTNFPHSPEDQEQSMMDYLEDKLSNGYRLVSTSWYGGTSFLHCIFEVVAK